MRFAVTRACGGGGGRARAGALYIGGSTTAPIETPSLLISTRKGLPNFVSRDHLAALPTPDSLLLHMLGLHEHFFVAAPRDSLESLPESDGTNKLGASFETPCGRRLIASLKPNLWASIADEVPAWVSGKRNKTSIDRTLRWLDECLALDPVCKGFSFET
ncbi:hypothetical protein GW17_00045985 [Ensete ventricosum]|nr:hypothetical protein GW17_00045985 [Ensete ventricosum]RZR86853.1 hypothetical protein BHM03_00014135 [Ensete ventricosum]